jgi:hypothetical protein
MAVSRECSLFVSRPRRSASWLLRGWFAEVLGVLLMLAAPAVARAQTCPGDCNGDGIVSVDEMIIAANVALGMLSVRACPSVDRNGDGVVGVDEAVIAVDSGVSGCGQSHAAGARSADPPEQIELGVVTGSAGAQVAVDATLHTMGNVVAGVQNDIAFDPYYTPIIGCDANPAIGKGVFTAFHPIGCTPGVDCTSIRLLVLSLSDVNPIPDGSVLYTCRVAINKTAPDGTYPLTMSNLDGSTSDGVAIPTDGIDGAVIVDGGAICAGDCDLDGTVTINETVEGLNILLGIVPPSTCPQADLSGTGTVTIDESVAAVGNSVSGCGSSPSGPPGTAPVTIQLGVVSGTAGAQVSFDAQLLGNGQSVAGTQNDISVDPFTPLVSCVVNPAIDKSATSFVFSPEGCTPGVDCTSVRAAVLSLSDVNPIPDGAVLYTCTVAISPSAPDGSHPLSLSTLGASTPGGRPITTFAIDGAVISSGGVIPTPTPTPAPSSATIIVGDASGEAGQTVTFDVGLETNGDVAGTENELQFDAGTPIVFTACTVNAGINKLGSAFAFRPTGCVPNVNCSGVKALILSFANLDPIPSGSTLYSCDALILDGASPGNYLIDCFAPGAATPDGQAVPTTCTDGHVTVLPSGPPVAPASLILEKARLRANGSTDPNRVNGSLVLAGVINANAPFGGLTDEITGSGLRISVGGAGGVDFTLQWTATQCVSRSTSKGPQVQCTADDAAGRRRVSLRSTRPPNLLAIKVIGTHLDVAGPFTADPVSANLQTTSFQRPDSVGGCQLGHRNSLTVCREHGAVP